MSTTPTATQLAEIKRTAKARAKEQGSSYNAMLEHVARERGYESWFAARQLRKRGTPSPARLSQVELPIDPDLPPGFDDTPNEELTEAEITQWWMRPYAVTGRDGRLEVRCRDGGAWDRSTHYGVADSPAAALILAKAKLSKWLEFLDTPMAVLDEGKVAMTIDCLWPDAPRAVLIELEDMRQAGEWLAEFRRMSEIDPQEVRRVRRQAREAALDSVGLSHRGFRHVEWLHSI